MQQGSAAVNKDSQQEEFKLKKRALISVSDKNGIVDFAKELASLGYEIISTGGTKKALQESGVDVIGVSDVTGFPEILEGRVKTLNPMIHGGLLAKFDQPGHHAQMEEHGIDPISIVCVNLYPFQQTIAKSDASVEDAIENIDIGGPAMLRASAKITNMSQWSSIPQTMEPSFRNSMKTVKPSPQHAAGLQRRSSAIQLPMTV